MSVYDYQNTLVEAKRLEREWEEAGPRSRPNPTRQQLDELRQRYPFTCGRCGLWLQTLDQPHDCDIPA